MKILIAVVLSVAWIWLTHDSPSQLNNVGSSTQVQTVQAKPIETRPQATLAVAEEKAPTEPITQPLQTVSAIPERVFCGSPAQRNWKTPIRENAALGRDMAKQYGWTDTEWTALLELYSCESSWNHMAGNPSSGACGIPQSWPCKKLANSVSDYRSNVGGQITWGYEYIAKRYKKPSIALAFHYRNNWY